MSKTRLEAFSDGVFAIAITLLVLTLPQPPAGTHDVAHELLSQWPGYASYVLSFVVIGVIWVNHHAVFARIVQVDRVILFLNLLLLMVVVFIPYPTGLLGRFFQEGHDTGPAAVLYSITMELMAISFSALWIWAAAGRRLLGDAFPAAEVRRSIVRFSSGTIAYLVAIVLAFISAPLCLLLHGLLDVYYVADQVATRGALPPAEPEPGPSRA